MTLSHQVLHILAEDPLSRDDDSRLSCVLWKTFYPQCVKKVTTEKPVEYHQEGVSLYDILNVLPKMDTISRARRIIQNTLGLYPPTSLAVAKGRKMKEEDWREAMRIEVTPAEAKKMLDILLKNKKII